MSATTIFAEWAAEKDSDWSGATEGARRAFVDTLACILAACRMPDVEGVRRVAETMGQGQATVIGQRVQMSASWAAFVNGTAAHVLDYDDCLDPAMSHPSAPMVPAIIALAEETGASGYDCLDAYLVGFEVMSRLGEGVNLAHYLKGWHTTLSLGSMGVAAACGRLLRLEKKRMAMAIGLASSMAGGSKRQFGSMAKPLHSGLAAKNGILAARLAEAEVTSAEEVLEGKWGLVDMVAGPEAAGFDGLETRIGNPNAMEQYGVWLKLYPCCASTHRPIDAVFLAREGGVAAADVAHISASISASAMANLRFKHPANIMEARFSLPYCIAIALLDGEVALRHFTQESISRSDVAELIDRISMAVDPELDGAKSVSQSFERASLDFQLKGKGAVVRKVVTVPFGHSDKPLSNSQLRGKLYNCAGTTLSPEGCDRLWSVLSTFADLPNMQALAGIVRL